MKYASLKAVRFSSEPAATSATATFQERLPAPAAHLTPRQLEVLTLLCEGLPNKLVCRALVTGTVKVHINSILRELGV